MVTLLLSAPVAAQGSGNFDLLQLLLGASGVVRGVLFLLVCLSIIGWYVIGYKALYLNRAQGESLRFLEAFWQAKRLDAVYQEAEHKRRSPIAHMFKAGYVELSKLQNAKAQGGAPAPGEVWHGEGDLENIERALRRAATHESTVLESMVPVSRHRRHRAAPFIGLFGTVIGIIDAFHSDRQSGLGQPRHRRAGHRRGARHHRDRPRRRGAGGHGLQLVSRGRSRCSAAEMDAFANDFLNIVKRHFLR